MRSRTSACRSAADFAPWRAMRDDRSRTGPFQKLPVLHWGDRLIAEMLMIAAFVHEASGDASSLSDEDNLRHGMLTSSLCHDMMNPIAILLWAEVMYPGADVAAIAKRTLDRLKRTARRSSSRSSTGAGSTARATAASWSSTACSGRSSTWRASSSARIGRWPRRPRSRGSTTSSRPARRAKPCSRSALPDHGAARRGRGHRENSAAARLSLARPSAAPAARGPWRRESR